MPNRRLDRGLTEEELHELGKAFHDAVIGAPLPFKSNEELESIYPELKKLGDKYREELEKYRNWEALK